MLALINSRPVLGKSVEGGDREVKFKEILKQLTNGNMLLEHAFQEVELELPKSKSTHSSNNRVFPDGWAERLIRTQFSRFYNQAILMGLLEVNEKTCFVPHSPHEQPDSNCSRNIAGKKHDTLTLLAGITNAFEENKWDSLKIPDHPHCTHVATPVSSPT